MGGSGRWFRYVGGRTMIDVPRWWLQDIEREVPFEAPDMADPGGPSAADDLAGHPEFVECTADGSPVAAPSVEG